MESAHKANSEHRSVLPVVAKLMGNTCCKKWVIFPGKPKNSRTKIKGNIFFLVRMDLSQFATQIVHIIFVIVSEHLILLQE